MYPDTTPITIRYIWDLKHSAYTEELEQAFKSVGCGRRSYGSYPACVRMWNQPTTPIYNWELYIILCDMYFNYLEAYLVEHYPMLAMEAFLLQESKDGEIQY